MIYLKVSDLLGDSIYFEILQGMYDSDKRSYSLLLLTGRGNGEIELKAVLYEDDFVEILFPAFSDTYGLNPVTLFDDITETELKAVIATALNDIRFSIGSRPTLVGKKQIKEVIAYKSEGQVSSTIKNYKFKDFDLFTT